MVIRGKSQGKRRQQETLGLELEQIFLCELGGLP
jgi:hypothetical protein